VTAGLRREDVTWAIREKEYSQRLATLKWVDWFKIGGSCPLLETSPKQKLKHAFMRNRNRMH